MRTRTRVPSLVLMLGIVIVPTVATPARAQAPQFPAESLLLDPQLTEFMRTLRMPMGVELAPATDSGARVVPLPGTGDAPLPAGTEVAEAMSWLMARRPGYEWTRDKGVITVRPGRSPAAPGNWLDSPVGSFETTDLTMGETLEVLGSKVTPAFTASQIAARPGSDDRVRLPAAIRVPAELSFAKRFSVRVAGGTVRQILDAIVDAHGEAGWIAAFRGPAPTRDACRINIVFWTIGGFLVSPDAPPAAAPASGAFSGGAMIPMPLTPQRLSFALARLGLMWKTPMGMVLPTTCEGGMRQGLLDLRSADFAGSLEALLAQCPGHVVESRAGVTIVAPAGSLSRNDTLKMKVRSIRVEEVPAGHVLWKLSEAITGLARPRAEPPPLTSPEARASWERPVTLALKNVTVLDVLNELVKAHGALSWVLAVDRFGNPTIGLQGPGWGLGVSARRR